MANVKIVIGGQFGSEGKGAVVAYLTQPNRRQGPVLVIRTGGPNAGHSMRYKQETFKMRHIPCSWHNPNAVMALGPGAIVDIDWLLREEIPMVEAALRRTISGSFFVDPMCAVITHQDKENELLLTAGIGSTGKGIGSATAGRVMRTGKLAKDYEILKPYLADIEDLAFKSSEAGTPIMIETTQGFGLSLTRSGYYPFATSRDITPAQALNDAGIPSQVPHDVIAVFRTYPIRVAGTSGPMHQELTWKNLAERTGGYIEEERTTVTNKIRRVGEWDESLARKAIRALQPNHIVLSFFDYVRPDLIDGKSFDSNAYDLIGSYENSLKRKIRWVSIGFQRLVDLSASD